MLMTIGTQIIGREINSVNARELHDFIEAKQQFGNWITNRIKKYGFIEYEDYIINLTKKEGNNATLKEYHITLDMAKELAMVENNDKGRQARRYFISCEKKALELNQSKPVKDDIDTKNILVNIAKSLDEIAKNTRPENDNIIVNSEKVQNLDNAKTHFQISKRNKNDNLKNKEKFYQDILKVIANHPDGASQRTLLKEAGYSQSKKIRRWLQEQISILWDMTIIPGKCYKYVLR